MNFKKIKLKPIHYAIIIFLLVFSVSFAVHYPEYPCWDGTVYLLNGEFFFGKVYLQDEIRPPILSVVYGVILQFTKNIYILNIIDLLIRGAAAVAVFYLARKFMSDKYAAIATLLGFLNPITLIIPLFMSEFLGILFLSLSIGAFINITCNSIVNSNKKTREKITVRQYIVAYTCAIAAFLTRYPLLVFCGILGLWTLIEWRKIEFKKLFVGVSVALALLFSWLIWNWIVYADPIISIRNAFMHINYDAQAMPWWYYFWGANSLPQLFNIGLIFLILGAFWLCKHCSSPYSGKSNNRKESRMLIAWMIAYLVFVIFTAHKLPRYLFYFLIFAYIVIYYGLAVLMSSKFMKKQKAAKICLFTFLAICLILPSFFMHPPNESYNSKIYHIEGAKLKEILPPDAILAAYESPEIAYSTHHKTYTFQFTNYCEYLACPIYPLGFYKKYGCENISYAITVWPINASCLKELPKDVWNSTNLYVYEYERNVSATN